MYYYPYQEHTFRVRVICAVGWVRMRVTVTDMIYLKGLWAGARNIAHMVEKQGLR